MDEKPSIEKKLKDWLESQGYPLEILVGSSLQKVGFHTIQSEYYADPLMGLKEMMLRFIFLRDFFQLLSTRPIRPMSNRGMQRTRRTALPSSEVV